MASFLYFFPGLESSGAITWRQIPSEAGLSHLEGASIESRSPCAGPAGNRGLLVSVVPSHGSGGVQASCIYDAGRQVWTEVKRDGKVLYWLGWEKASPPGPKDLVRPKTLEGHPVKLADGNEWRIPVIAPVRHTTLPRSFFRGDNGQVHLRVKRPYRDLCAESEHWFTLFAAGGQYQWGDAFKYSTSLLALNYRVGPAEIDGECLDLLDTENFWEVVAVSLGAREMAQEEEAKKTVATADAG